MVKTALITKAALVLLITGGACLADSSTNAWATINKGLQGNSGQRAQAVTALGTLGLNPRAEQIARQALRDPSPKVRAAAAGALGAMNAKAAIPDLENALKDTKEVQFAAAQALWNMGDMAGRTVYQKLLTGQLKESPGLVKSALNDAHRRMHDPRGLAFEAVNSASGPFIGPGVVGLMAVEKALPKDTTANERVLGANFLANDPNPYATTLLEWALQDHSPVVRAAVARALGQRGDASAVDKLIPVMNDSNATVRYMAAAAIIRLESQPAKLPENSAARSVAEPPAGSAPASGSADRK